MSKTVLLEKAKILASNDLAQYTYLQPFGSYGDLFTDTRGFGFLFRPWVDDGVDKHLAFFYEDGSIVVIGAANQAFWKYDLPTIKDFGRMDNDENFPCSPLGVPIFDKGEIVQTYFNHTTAKYVKSSWGIDPGNNLGEGNVQLCQFNRYDVSGGAEPCYVAEFLSYADYILFVYNAQCETRWQTDKLSVNGYISSLVNMGDVSAAFTTAYQQMFNSMDSDLRPYLNRAYKAMVASGASKRTVYSRISTIISGKTNGISNKTGIAIGLPWMFNSNKIYNSYDYVTKWYYPRAQQPNVLPLFHTFVPVGFPTQACRDTAAKHLLGNADQLSGKLRPTGNVAAVDSWSFISELSSIFTQKLDPSTWKEQNEQGGVIASYGLDSSDIYRADGLVGMYADSLLMGPLVGTIDELVQELYRTTESELKSDVSFL